MRSRPNIPTVFVLFHLSPGLSETLPSAGCQDAAMRSEKERWGSRRVRVATSDWSPPGRFFPGLLKYHLFWFFGLLYYVCTLSAFFHLLSISVSRRGHVQSIPSDIAASPGQGKTVRKYAMEEFGPGCSTLAVALLTGTQKGARPPSVQATVSSIAVWRSRCRSIYASAVSQCSLHDVRPG